MPRVFAYGTLGFPEIVHALTGRRFSSQPAVLEGFARYRVRGRSYPGIVPVPGARTAGVLFDGVDLCSLAALTYVVAAGRRQCLGREPWDRERFAARHVATYRAQCAQLRRAAAVQGR